VAIASQTSIPILLESHWPNQDLHLAGVEKILADIDGNQDSAHERNHLESLTASPRTDGVSVHAGECGVLSPEKEWQARMALKMFSKIDSG
jgi:hypothetical protein